MRRLTASVLVLLLVSAGSCGDSSDVFDFSSQDLCEWFSAAEITQIVTSTYEDLNVQPLPDALVQSHDQNSDCFWAGDALVTLSQNDELRAWRQFERHAVLDDRIHVSIQGDGNYGLMWGIDALLTIDGHDEQLWFGYATPGTVPGVLSNDVEMINTVGLTIANKMLQDMGWTDDS